MDILTTGYPPQYLQGWNDCVGLVNKENAQQSDRLKVLELICGAGTQEIIGHLLATKYQQAEQIKQVQANAAFFRCCAISGEVPMEGSEPFPPQQEESDG